MFYYWSGVLIAYIIELNKFLDHFFCLLCYFIPNMNQFFSIQGIPASEVQCDIDQLYDLTDRPDVVRSGWDGTDVDYDVTIS